MRKLPPDFDGEFEAWRGAIRATFRCLWITGMIKRRIDFDRIEVPGIETKLVSLLQGIENAGPGSRTGSGWIAPAAGADPPDACVSAFRLWRERWQEGQQVSPYPR